jgi:hypothetical protein
MPTVKEGEDVEDDDDDDVEKGWRSNDNNLLGPP